MNSRSNEERITYTNEAEPDDKCCCRRRNEERLEQIEPEKKASLALSKYRADRYRIDCFDEPGNGQNEGQRRGCKKVGTILNQDNGTRRQTHNQRDRTADECGNPHNRAETFPRAFPGGGGLELANKREERNGNGGGNKGDHTIQRRGNFEKPGVPKSQTEGQERTLV